MGLPAIRLEHLIFFSFFLIVFPFARSVEALADKIEQKRIAAPAKGEALEGEEPEEAEEVQRQHAMLSEDEQVLACLVFSSI